MAAAILNPTPQRLAQSLLVAFSAGDRVELDRVLDRAAALRGNDDMELLKEIGDCLRTASDPAEMRASVKLLTHLARRPSPGFKANA